MQAMQQLAQGTTMAMTEIAKAVSAMTETVAQLQKPKSATVKIEKQADGTFIGTKTEE